MTEGADAGRASSVQGKGVATRHLLLVTGGFLAGAAVIAAVAVALPARDHITISQAPTAVTTAGMMGQSGSGMMSAVSSTRTLTIVHVLRGCHVWSNGQVTASMMRLKLSSGQKLSVLDMDVDAHQMLQFAGPVRLHLGGPMTMMHRRLTISFSKPGVYRLGTKTVDGVGMGSMMDVKTIGPDNELRLVVTVG